MNNNENQITQEQAKEFIRRVVSKNSSNNSSDYNKEEAIEVPFEEIKDNGIPITNAKFTEDGELDQEAMIKEGLENAKIKNILTSIQARIDELNSEEIKGKLNEEELETSIYQLNDLKSQIESSLTLEPLKDMKLSNFPINKDKLKYAIKSTDDLLKANSLIDVGDFVKVKNWLRDIILENDNKKYTNKFIYDFSNWIKLHIDQYPLFISMFCNNIRIAFYTAELDDEDFKEQNSLIKNKLNVFIKELYN